MKKFLFRVVALSLAASVSLVVVELGARVAWKSRYVSLLEAQTRGFDKVDRDRRIIVPEPGEGPTVTQLIADLKTRGKAGGIANVEELVARFGLTDSDRLFRINRYGFKGPEIEIPKPANVYRILTIGDSCTWGPYYERASYPRVMERRLKQSTETRRRIEVVNGGVMGYNTSSVLRRVNDLVATDPDLVTIYIGWNGTIVRADPRKIRFLYRHSGSYRILYHLLMDKRVASVADVGRGSLLYDEEDEIVPRLRETDFSYDLLDIEHVIDAFRDKDPDVQVVVITLAGLFDERLEPDARAMEMAFPVSFTDNLFAWAVLSSEFNEQLREFCSRHGIQLVDYEQWALDHLEPRSDYFSDPVHPSIDGYERLGLFLADELERLRLIGDRAPSPVSESESTDRTQADRGDESS